MGLFGDAASRFLRTRWKAVQPLAEELFGIFTSSNIDLQPQSITINQAPGATIPPLVINQPAGGNNPPPIQIVQGDTIVNIGSSDGGGGGGGGGNINYGDIIFPGQEPGDINVAVPPPNENPIVLHGRVVGKTGGQVYKVRCWARDPNRYPPIGVIDVIFTDVDTNDLIPAGHSTAVVAFPGADGTTRTIVAARGYVPVFLTPEG